MHWTTAVSRDPQFDQALDAVSRQVITDLDGEPDLVFVFITDHYRDHFDELPARLGEKLGPGTLFGCSASGVIGSHQEIEFQPSVTLTAARLPGARWDAWHIEAEALAPGTEHSLKCAAWAESLGDEPAQFIILADPFTFPSEQLLRSLETGFPSAVIAGGLASGTRGPGDTALFLDQSIQHSGALILALGGSLEMSTAVAQGCRPIGQPMFVTACEGGLILELDGQPPLPQLNVLYEQSNERDQALMQQSLFLGLAMHPQETRHTRGDYLIRNLLGADQQRGSIQVSAELHPQQVVQFHLRDASTSKEDLALVLDKTRKGFDENPPLGALLFSCTGRGEGLYGVPGHDSEAFHQVLGDTTPLGGFFCNGEIGPVAGKTFLHGYTSAFALFSKPRARD
ncbi:MAG: FIST N-terminal domain-containing protein [Candidatus Thiodiazotropha sp.]